MKYLFINLIILIFCVSCEMLPKPKEYTSQEIRNLVENAELGTVEYTINKIVKASDEATWYKFGDRKILFSCKAYVKAGIDLKYLSNSDIIVDNLQKAISINLPKAKILSFDMPANESVLIYEKISITRFNFSATERNLLLQQGEADIRNEIQNLNIFNEAEHNAEMFFRAMLGQLGFLSITINFV